MAHKTMNMGCLELPAVVNFFSFPRTKFQSQNKQVAVTIFTRCEVNARIRGVLCLELSHSMSRKTTTLSWYFHTVKCFLRCFDLLFFYCTFSSTIGLFGFALLMSCLVVTFLPLSTVSEMGSI